MEEPVGQEIHWQQMNGGLWLVKSTELAPPSMSHFVQGVSMLLRGALYVVCTAETTNRYVI